MKKDNMMIRKAERRDVQLLLEFIKGIARWLDAAALERLSTT